VIVIADTSVFLNLGCVGHEELLPALYAEIVAPGIVRAEFLLAVARYPRFHGLVFPSWVQIREPRHSLSTFAPWADLHPGESAAIALAADLHPDFLIIDEARGRAVARRLGLPVTGLLSVLAEARRRDLLPSVAPILDLLVSRAGFWLDAETRAHTLRLAGETP
jgi:predicted nucleic acid-binding protein